MSRRSSSPVALVAGALVCLGAAAARAESPASGPAAGELAEVTWRAAPDGRPFRIRFDPGQRWIAGAALGWSRAAGEPSGVAGPSLEVGLLLRSERPAPGWDVQWKRNHELARLRIDAAGASADRPGRVTGTLYRGVLLRQSQEGTLTLPTAPPVAIPLPFDVGLGLELGRFEGAPAALFEGSASRFGRLRLGVVEAEMLADFWRARRPGRWLAVGIGGRYDIAVGRDPAGGRTIDHRVAPLTALSLAARAERENGLAAAGLRLEAAHRFSSVRGWERAFRADLDAELVPLAFNDRPLALFAQASAAIAPDLEGPELRLVCGVRFAQPL